ncbi:hypothetical protein NPIL_704971 [Nephila pilipes]|uniref:Uncharacterized protein n=1 Tax=Nephila pilipes TaxID=299642 RepID=A0A8X6UKT8_NEPPI|nr:hypothetical protein NPIL_704971 [Nephila pilipes]
MSVLSLSSRIKHMKPDQNFYLCAANSSKINTYVSEHLYLDLSFLQRVLWTFIVGDVTKPIMDANFLKQFGFLVYITRNHLVYSMTSLSSIGRIVNGFSSKLTTITIDINNLQIKALLKEFKCLTIQTTQVKTVLHPVTHHIVTNSSLWLPKHVISLQTN